jgi:hypothetical protein
MPSKIEWLKVGTVAARLEISRYRVHQLIHDERFPSAFQLEDGTWLIDAKDLQRDDVRIRIAGRPKKQKE